MSGCVNDESLPSGLQSPIQKPTSGQNTAPDGLRKDTQFNELFGYRQESMSDTICVPYLSATFAYVEVVIGRH